MGNVLQNISSGSEARRIEYDVVDEEMPVWTPEEQQCIDRIAEEVKKITGDNLIQGPIEDGFTDSDDNVDMIIDSGSAHDYILLIDKEEAKVRGMLEKHIAADIDVVHDDKEEIDIVMDSGAAAW